MSQRRVAFFTDSYHEVNGVALTSREFVRFAQRRSVPLFAVHAGQQDGTTQDGSITTWEFKRGPFRWTLEHDLAIDLLFLRLRKRLLRTLREFQPDIVHITGPGDAGILGAFAAYDLGVPLAASWHTNLHEFAARRLARSLRRIPEPVRSTLTEWTERWVLNRCVRFYRLARVLFAPNPELVELLSKRTGRPTFLMQRGIDTELFSPARRSRQDTDFVIGYVGRLSPEKNVRMFIELENALIAAGLSDYRFLLVGEGSERPALKESLHRAQLPGVLRGEDLARAYASMDVLVFPSATDTFGNVVLEAMASGVVPIVTASGGPKFLVQDGATGYVAVDIPQFVSAILQLYRDSSKRSGMAKQARTVAEGYSWDRVFDQVLRGYDACFQSRHSTVTNLSIHLRAATAPSRSRLC